ncbi:hypothetical protein BDR04DRAFT_94991 [Suillus decipiens]|nr:hypothetical protein BDR04DRAFT_94991 [Suillus decipiens]
MLQEPEKTFCGCTRGIGYEYPLGTAPVNVPKEPLIFQRTVPAASKPVCTQSNFSSGPAAQPVVQSPGLNSMTHKVTPFAQSVLSFPAMRSSEQAPREQRSTPHQPPGVPLMPINDQQGEVTWTFLGHWALLSSPVVDTHPSIHPYLHLLPLNLTLPSLFWIGTRGWRNRFTEISLRYSKTR